MSRRRRPASSGVVTQPLTPCSTTSRGPKSQAVTRAGAPQASASATTVGKPSQREGRTKSAALAIHAQGLAAKPRSRTRSPTPSACGAPLQLRLAAAPPENDEIVGPSPPRCRRRPPAALRAPSGAPACRPPGRRAGSVAGGSARPPSPGRARGRSGCGSRGRASVQSEGGAAARAPSRGNWRGSSRPPDSNVG